jgi:hypothetical protein
MLTMQRNALHPSVTANMQQHFVWGCLYHTVPLPVVLPQASFPGVNFTVVNLARGGIDVSAAALCWYQLAPQVRTGDAAASGTAVLCDFLPMMLNNRASFTDVPGSN